MPIVIYNLLWLVECQNCDTIFTDIEWQFRPETSPGQFNLTCPNCQTTHNEQDIIYLKREEGLTRLYLKGLKPCPDPGCLNGRDIGAPALYPCKTCQGKSIVDTSIQPIYNKERS